MTRILLLQGCLREGRPGCGPGSAAAEAFPRVVAAALPRLVSAVMIFSEGVEKASKVHSTSSMHHMGQPEQHVFQ